MNRKAVVVGATGLVGMELVQLLLSDLEYTTVTLIVRRTTGISHPKLDEKIIDFEQLGITDVDLSGADVFCTLGTTIKKAGTQEAFRQVDYTYPLELGRMAKAKGAKQFLIVTSMGANPSSRSFYIRVKGEIEEALRDVKLPSLHIFRPSLLLGKREEFRIGERIASFAFNLFAPLFSGTLRKYSPVHARTVAKSMLFVAKKSLSAGNYVYESDQIISNN